MPAATRGARTRDTPAAGPSSDAHCASEAAAEQALLLKEYSVLKQHVAAKNYGAALQQGWDFLQRVHTALPRADQSSCLQQLSTAARLNVVLCTAEVQPVQLEGLPKLCAVIDCALLDLRRSSDATDKQHASLLCRCLLKIALAVAKQATAASPQGNSACPSAAVTPHLQRLLAALIAAAYLCGQPQLPQQVACKALEQLPAGLRHCVMAALFDAALQAHAGGSRQGSKLYGTAEADTAHMPSSAPLLPASLALQCLQHLAQHTQLDAACASACVSNLVGSTQAAQSHAALSATVCLLTAALCSGVNPQLPDSATATLRTAISHHAQLLLRQRCPTNGNVEAASAGAMISSSSSCGTVPAPAAVSATSAAGQRACSDAVDVQTSMLRLQAWACGRLLEDKGPELLASACPLITALASCTVETALRCAQAAVQERAKVLMEALGSFLAGAADCLACWARQRSGLCVLADAAAGPVLQQLCWAVELFISWPALQQRCTTAAHSGPCRASGMPDTSTLRWLAQRLQAAAIAACGVEVEATEGISNTRLNNHVAAGLWLLAVECDCVTAAYHAGTAHHVAADDAAIPSGLIRDGAADPSGSSPLHYGGAVEAAALTLQGAKAYFSFACGCLRAAAGAAAPAHSTARPAAAAAAVTVPAAIQANQGVLQSAQAIMQVAAGVLLQLSASQQLELHGRWQSAVRGYSRLRCVAGAVAPGSAAQVCSQKPEEEVPGCTAPQPRPPDADLQQQTVMPSVLQLVSALVPPSAAPLAGLVRLWWLEGAALSQLAAAAGCKQQACASAAVQLLQVHAAEGLAVCSTADKLQLAEVVLVHGMLLLLLDDERAHDTSSGANLHQEATSCLSRACELFGLELHLPCHGSQHKTPSYSSSNQGGGSRPHRRQHGTCSSTSSSERARDDSSRRAVCGRRQRSEAEQLQEKVQLASSCGSAAVDADAACQPASADADTLAAAALCHCLLGLLQAHAAQAMGACLGEEKAHTQPPPPGEQSAAAEDGAVQGRHDAAPDKLLLQVVEQWDVVLRLLQQTSSLLAVSLAAVRVAHVHSRGSDSSHDSNNSCRGGRSCSLWYGGEAAVAVSAAWHLAGLQDWSSCQHACATVLHDLLRMGVQGPHQQLSACLPLLHAQGSSPATARSWLWSLMQQQAPPRTGLLAAVGQSGISARAGSGDADQQPLPGCHCKLRSRQQQLLALGQELQRGSQDSSWNKLQQVQLQLASAVAAKCCGDIAVAAAVVELATRQCRALLGAGTLPQQQGQPAAPGISSCNRTRQQRAIMAVCQLSLHWHTLGLYMSGLWQFAELHEAAGNPHDAVRALKELHRLSCSAGCFSFAVVAQASLSRVYCGLGDANRAGAAVAIAVRMHRLLARLHQQSPSAEQQSHAHASISAAVASAQATVALQAQQHAEAQRQLQSGLEVLQRCQGSSESGTAAWRLLEQQAQVHVQLAHVHQQLGDQGVALRQLGAAAAALRDAGGQGCGSCCCGPWPTTWATIQLRILAIDSSSHLTADTTASCLQLAGFRRGCHSNDLLEEFSKAASAAEHSGRAPPPSVVASSNSGSGGSIPLKSRCGPARAATSAPCRGARSSKAAGKPTRPASPAADQGGALGSEGPPDGGPCSKGPAEWLCRVLQMLPLVAQQPQVLKQMCEMLVNAFVMAGAVEATAVFQHLALGTSLTQQQLMLATSKLFQAQQLAASAGRTGEASAAAVEPDQVWSTVQSLTAYTGLLQQVASVARAALDHSPDEPTARLQQLVKAVDAAAQAWLVAALRQLPDGAAVCSLSCQADAATAGCQRNLLLSRVHSAAAGGRASCLFVQLPVPTSTQGPCVMEQLQSLLSDASASMQLASTSGRSSSHDTAAWWQQRLELDSRMTSLLQELDQKWLGAWRCLLMQPATAAEEDAALAASHGIVSEHFDSVLDDKSKHLLGQLLSRLVVNQELCSASELASALQDLGTMVQQRMDGWHLQQLLSDMEVAHTTSAAADTAPQTSSARTETATGTGMAADAAVGVGGDYACVGGGRASGRQAHKKRPESQTAEAYVGVAATPAQRRLRSSIRPPATAQPPNPVSAMHQISGRTAAAAAGGNGVVPVPPSIARHAQRRSRLKALSSGAGRQLEAASGAVALCCEEQGCTGSGAQDGGKLGSSTGNAQPSSEQAQGSSSSSSECQQERWAPSVVLVMDDCVQQLPWESCSGLQGSNIYRCPSLSFASALAARTVASRAGVPPRLQLSHSYYLLNPDGDLTGTQHTFEQPLQQLCAKGLAGRCPAPGQLLSALQGHDLYLYFGHGAGEQYLPLPSLRKLDSCAASLLMGCSSGRLRLAGGFEAHGPVWAYLMAGCPAVVANLWDVTDRDIDRFAARLLQQWSPAQAGGLACLAQPTGLSMSVSVCRPACRLPALIGAAPVCYGLPAAVHHASADAAADAC